MMDIKRVGDTDRYELVNQEPEEEGKYGQGELYATYVGLRYSLPAGAVDAIMKQSGYEYVGRTVKNFDLELWRKV